MESIESSNNKIDLPKEFDGIQNKEQFLDVFEKVQNWYGGNFSGNEQKIIMEIWNKGCNEYGNKFNPTRLAILGNRIDTGIFEFKYPNFISIDKNIIRKINNTNKQRKFREVAIKLVNKYKNLFDSDIKIIEKEFNSAYNSQKAPNFDTIDGKISKNKGNPSHNETIPTQNDSVTNFSNSNGSSHLNYSDMWPSDTDVETMSSLKISPYFEDIKRQIFTFESFSKSGNKKYIEGFFNKCAYDVSELYGDNFENIDELKDELLIIFKKHSYSISEGTEKSYNNLLDDVKNKIIDINQGNSLEILANNAFDKNDKRDYSKYATSIELKEDDKKAIKFLCDKLSGNYTEEYVTGQFLKYKYLENKINNKEELTQEESDSYKKLNELFKQTKRLEELEEIKHKEYIGNHEYKVRNIKASIEYATGNIKDIHPMAIVENNKQISNYIYGDKGTQEELDFNNITLTYEDKIRLFDKLKQEKKTDLIFLESIKYLNNDLSINNNLVNSAGIEMQSVIDNQKKIENMIKDLALKENLERQDKEKIREINVRRSCMVCCFRAISNFFDTVNNNGENFASEFEIENVNENIKFDEKTGIITMEGTIGANRNHVKLYYDTKNGTLEFDDFLVYNPEDGSESYSIGNGNKKRRKIGLELPKMSEMEKTAKSINSNLISKLSLNMNQYNRMQGFAMSEAVYLKHFVGLLGVSMESVKGEVQKFNEENILKQDIIKTIYSKFYNVTDINEKLSDCLIIDAGNKPEQFKLIELIYNTIDNYRKESSTSKLLRLRNYINEFDKILTTNHELVEKDNLLRYLFADNPNVKNDAVDSSKNILENENKDLTILNDNRQVITYQNHNDMIKYQKYENQGNKELNYYIFLNLLAKDEGDKRIINLDWFESALNIMNSNDGSQISEMNYASFRENIDNFKNQQDIYSIESTWGNAYEK